MQPTPVLSGRLKSIDCLRGIAALAVVFHHAMNYGEYQQFDSLWFRVLSAISQEGHLGVPLFFVISGFCIHLPYARQKSLGEVPRVEFFPFWKRRFSRLYPPYLIALGLSMALVGAAYLKHSSVPLLLLYPEPRPRWMAFDFLLHALMLQGFSPTFDKAGGNPPLWTLAREEYLYLLYFGLLFWRRRASLLSGVGVTLAIGVAFQLVLGQFVSEGSPAWSLVASSAIALWVQWHLGAVAVEAHFGLIQLPAWTRQAALIPVWALLAKASETYLPLLTPILWGMTFFTLVNACTQMERKGKWATDGVMGWLGRVGIFSYSLYLVHSPLRGLSKQLMGSFARTSSPELYCLNVAIIVIIAYYAGKVFFRLVESRFLPGKLVTPVRVEIPSVA